MIAALEMSPEVLRPLLHAKIDALADDELAKLFLELQRRELRRSLKQICEEFDEDWNTGRITQDKVDAAIRNHRTKHPHSEPTA